jgi:hypothetical protein
MPFLWKWQACHKRVIRLSQGYHPQGSNQLTMPRILTSHELMARSKKRSSLLQSRRRNGNHCTSSATTSPSGTTSSPSYSIAGGRMGSDASREKGSRATWHPSAWSTTSGEYSERRDETNGPRNLESSSDDWGYFVDFNNDSESSNSVADDRNCSTVKKVPSRICCEHTHFVGSLGW